MRRGPRTAAPAAARSVDRRFYPARRAVLTAIEGLRQQTHAGLAKPEQLESTLRAALRDPDLRVGFRVPGQPVSSTPPERPWSTATPRPRRSASAARRSV
jgi:hypothetical protein